MSGYTAYCLYRAIIAHFTTPSYNAVSKKFGTRGSLDAYESRKDKYIFKKLAKEYPDEKELINFYVANYMANKSLHPQTATKENYLKWLRINSSLSYYFKEDLETIFEKVHSPKDFAGLFKCGDEHPKIFTLLLQKKIYPESFIILDKLVQFSKIVDKNLKFRMVWDQHCSLYNKYSSFVEYDLDEMKTILSQYMERYLRKQPA